MAGLVLGPLLRYVGDDEATVWVETDAACEVEVLGCTQRTFRVGTHHYALVHVTGLEPGTSTEYAVTLDGHRVWPEAGSGWPASRIRTGARDQLLRLAWGSCRVSAPDHPPHSLPKDKHPDGREVDALRLLAERMRDGEEPDWPHCLILLGDQVYADEVPPEVRRFIAGRRDPEVPPGETVADFEEYTQLYRIAWSDPPIRWLLSTVPSAMVFDDHDVHDDWNTSRDWVETMRATGWWDDRIVGGFATYWIYQHMGNLSPAHLAEDEIYAKVRAADDAEQLLRDFAFRADREVAGTRWSYCRDFGHTRLIMVDSRAGRVLEPPDERSMLDPEEWDWLEEHVTGDFDHLLIGTSLPFLLTHGLQSLESWNEAVCNGAWGKTAARVGERIRQAVDLEHWAAFGSSLDRIHHMVERIGTAEGAPASIVALSGDVHHAYLAEVGFKPGTGMRSNVYQATCSPFRNPLNEGERMMIRFACSRAGTRLGDLLIRSAGVEKPKVRWRFCEGPYFDNQVCFLELHGRSARLRLKKTAARAEGDQDEGYGLETVFERPLT
jgi:hypothetical protein